MKHNLLLTSIILGLLIPSLSFAQPAETPAATQAAPAQAAEPQPEAKPMVFTQPVAAAAPPVAKAAPVKSKQSHVFSSWNQSKSPSSNDDLWQLKLYGYLRTGYTWQQGETEAQTNGFFTANARLGVSGNVYNKMFGFNILFDGASQLVTGKGDVTYGVSLKDAFLTFQPAGFLQVKVGQFIPTFTLEGFGSTSKRPFASLTQGGNKLAKGGREGGIAFGAYGYQPFDEASGLKDLGFTYEFAITNGSAKSLKKYDFGYYLRAGANWGSLVNFGLGYFYNPQPAIDGSLQGVAVDATSSFMNFTLITAFIHQIATLTKTTHTPSDAFQISAQYTLADFGITPGIRYEFMDPDSSEDGKDDKTQAVTFGLNWEMKNLPIKLVANYTLNLEEGTKQKNDKFEFIAQAKY